MPYDLYGTYYANRRDAENAEMAQCAAIDADIARRRIDELERQLHFAPQEQQHTEDESAYWIEFRISALENTISKLTSIY